MSIKSNAFGGVVLSGADAKKFRNQVIFGKPKAAAKATVKRGIKLSRMFQEDGMVVVTVGARKKSGTK